MPTRFHFQKQVLDCVVGGVSALDILRLHVVSPEEARQFVQAYGYDLDHEEHRRELWATHSRAVALIQDQLLDEGETIPQALYDPQQLQNIETLLLYASSRDPKMRDLQKWSCAILRVMHVYLHLRNDLFSAFSDEIQQQILKPLQDAINADPLAGSVILGDDQTGIRLHKFEIKPFKTTASSVIKLLARPEKVALTLLDKLGVRFVTRSVFDSFQVVRYLVEKNIVSYPHIIPDQSNNTLYPLNIFLEVMDELGQAKKILTPDEIEETLRARFEQHLDRAQFLEKANEFSGSDYRFVKFINRKIITIGVGEGANKRAFRFFYPYEIQIMDYDTYITNLSGPMAHDEYKKRQRIKARERALGLKLS